MRPPSVQTLKASLLLLALVSAVPLHAAEKEKPAALIGLTKEQVTTRLGDPRSQIKAGAREVMFFAKLKLTLRNGVVVETEEISDDPTQKRAPETPPATTPAPDATADATKGAKAAPSQPAAPTPAPAPADPAATAKGADATADAKSAAASGNNGGLEIKSVRPPSANAPRPVPRPATTSVATTPPPVAAPSTMPPVSQTTTPTTKGTVLPTAPGQPRVTLTPAPGSSPTSVAVAPAGTPATRPSDGAQTATAGAMTPDEKVAAPAAETSDATAVEEPAAKAKKAPPKRFFRRRADDEVEVPGEALFTTQTILFAIGIFGAVAYLIWRGKQRKLLLAVTSVSNTPFNEEMAKDTGALFTADLLTKLEWKRFEELIAAYYIKTGVIAVRTKTGPDSPVHLKISWKGEAKPFACVQCHANPPGLIRPGPLHALNEALTAAEIRRGYVVTNGKFNVEARDYAEEKHFTLLHGDLLLEKLNALPPLARSELLQSITNGDFSTASCPKCDARMTRTDDGGWRCPKCETVLPPRKV